MFTFYGACRAQNISRDEANTLISSLQKSKSANAQMSLLLKLAKFHIFKPGEFKPDLDSGLVCINQAEQLTKTLHSPISEGNILLLKAYYLKENGQKDLGKTSAEKAIAVLINEKDMNLLGESYVELSQHYSYETELDKKISLVEHAVACFGRAGAIERKARCYQDLGDLYFQKRDKVYTRKALEALDSSLKSYQSINFPDLQGVYILYSTIYSQTDNRRQGLRYAMLALQTAERVKDTTIQLCQINNIVGIIYTNLREYEKALPYQYKSLSIAEKYRDINAIYLLEYLICCTNIELKRANEAQKLLDRIQATYPQPTDTVTLIQQTRVHVLISEQLNKFDDLKYYTSKFASLLESYPLDNMAMLTAYHTIIRGFLKLKNYSLARKFLKKEQKLINLVPFSFRTAWFYKDHFSLDTATGDYKSAVYHLLKYNTASDSIFNQAKSQQIQQLQVEYDLAEKDKNINILTKDKEIQEGALKRSALTRDIIIATAALLLIIIFLLFNQFRLKQRSSKTIQKKNAVLEHMVTEKEWLLKEVHHRVKNNLQTVVSLLELQSENLRDEALTAIQDSQNRIYAMSLIHQKLYQTENVASINMQPYLQELTAHLQTVYNPEHKIDIELQVTALELDVSQAIPIGLIVNEAVTNSIKYAFNYGANRPEILIVLKQNKKDNLRLVVADNGVGLPPGFDIEEGSGLGFKLIKGLVDDIEGILTVESEGGTFVKIEFKASEPFVEKVERRKTEKAFTL
jgi:two-component sensor histidine kinase